MTEFFPNMSSSYRFHRVASTAESFSNTNRSAKKQNKSKWSLNISNRTRRSCLVKNQHKKYPETVLLKIFVNHYNTYQHIKAKNLTCVNHFMFLYRK